MHENYKKRHSPEFWIRPRPALCKLLIAYLGSPEPVIE